MTTILLIRHAVNDFVKSGRLAGWTPGVHLNEEGQAQAQALGHRLADAKLHAIYSSPLERTMETAQAIQAKHAQLQIHTDAEIGEVRYGDWEGQPIAALVSRKMWAVVQEYPSRAVFPNGEAMRDVQTRAVNAMERFVRQHPQQTVAVVSHADLIKMILAHYLGMHLDVFQRIVISPASMSVLNIGHSRPYANQINDVAHLKTLQREGKS
jgi:probable phosphomutase (TIGR03848 family)